MLKSGLRRIVLPRARARREPEKKPRDYVLLVWKALFMFLYHMDVHCTFRYILEPFFFCLWRATKLYSCLLQKVLKVTSNEIFLYQFAVFRFVFHIDQFIQLGTNRLNCCSKSLPNAPCFLTLKIHLSLQSMEMHQGMVGSRLYFSRAVLACFLAVFDSYVTLVAKALRKAMGFHISFLS